MAKESKDDGGSSGPNRRRQGAGPIPLVQVYIGNRIQYLGSSQAT